MSSVVLWQYTTGSSSSLNSILRGTGGTGDTASSISSKLSSILSGTANNISSLFLSLVISVVQIPLSYFHKGVHASAEL